MNYEWLSATPKWNALFGLRQEGELIATNEFFSIGGGFVVNEKTQSVHLSESFLAVFKRQSLSHTARRRLSQCHISADLT